MILFCCWAGVSLSEALGLSWSDVNTNSSSWTINIKRARVANIYKVPNEKSRARTIHLIEPAQKYLEEQVRRTKELKVLQINITQRDNFTIETKPFHPIFVNEIINGSSTEYPMPVKHGAALFLMLWHLRAFDSEALKNVDTPTQANYKPTIFRLMW